MPDGSKLTGASRTGAVIAERDEVTGRRFMQIGEVAERTGMTPRTLRYYEEKGLLDPPARMEGGFRLYSEEDVQRLELIKQMRDLLGVSLAEIREMVAAEEYRLGLRSSFRKFETDEQRVEGLRKAIRATHDQIELINHKIAALQQMRARLEERLARYRTSVERLGANV